MINVNFLSIDNSRMVSLLTPFWIRGKRAVAFITSALHPLITLHESFKEWALDKYIIAHVTTQKKCIEWYLNYRLRQHFSDEDDSFEIQYDTGYTENILFPNSELEDIDAYTAPIFHNGESQRELYEMIVYTKGEVIEATKVCTVYAPFITTEATYGNADYIRDINVIMRQFLTNFKKYNIVIAD